MSRLSQPQLNTLQAHIDYTVAYLDSLNLRLGISHDLSAFADYLKEQPATHGSPRTHDPAFTYIPPDMGFWIYAADGDRIVACHANVLSITDDFIADCLTQTYFGNLSTESVLAPCRVHPDSEAVSIHGRVCLGGGLYINPDYRGKKLGIINRVSRTIALRKFRLDFSVSTILDRPSRWRMARELARYHHLSRFMVNGQPGKPDIGDTVMCWSSAQELIEGIRQELEEAGVKIPQGT